MDAQGSSANVPVAALGRRKAKTVAAARALAVDYEPIIEDKVASLAHNTSDKRGRIYVHARRMVMREMHLMQLPEPVIELEKLALDLTIGKIERRWRAREAAKKKTAAKKALPIKRPKRPIKRPAITAMSIAATLLRPLSSPIGVAVALPIIAATIFFGLYAGDKVDSLIERWLDRGSGSGVTARVPTGYAMTDRRSTSVAPNHAKFAAQPKAPATTMAAPAASRRDVAVDGAEPYGAPAPDNTLTSLTASPRAAAPQALRSSLAKPINAKVAALMESGKQATLKGDLDRAVRDFSEAIRIDPKYPDSYSERGQTFFKLGEIERAIADYSAALAQDPQRGATLRARGMAHLYRGEADLALADLSKAIELAEHDPRRLAPIELFYARRSRGSIYNSKQQYSVEIADYTALIESVAHDPTLGEALAVNYGSAGVANTLAMVYRQRANAFIRSLNLERAVADLTAAIPLSSDRGYAALIERSKLHEGLGRLDLAAADVRAALNIRPGSQEARLALSRLTAASDSTSPKGL
jgi:tetratricopeptide (TPR) repeat protein